MTLKFRVCYNGEGDIMYNIFTQWITLSVIFFLTVYSTDILDVVTLGGLVAGSFIFAAWSVLLVLCQKRLPKYTGIALVMAGTAVGIDLLCTFMPGYRLKLSWELIIFMLFFAVFSIWQDKILKK